MISIRMGTQLFSRLFPLALPKIHILTFYEASSGSSTKRNKKQKLASLLIRHQVLCVVHGGWFVDLFVVVCFLLKTLLGSCWFQVTPQNLTSNFERVIFPLGPRVLRNMKSSCDSIFHLICSSDGLVYVIKKCIYLRLFCWFFLLLWCL